MRILYDKATQGRRSVCYDILNAIIVFCFLSIKHLIYIFPRKCRKKNRYCLLLFSWMIYLNILLNKSDRSSWHVTFFNVPKHYSGYYLLTPQKEWRMRSLVVPYCGTHILAVVSPSCTPTKNILSATGFESEIWAWTPNLQRLSHLSKRNEL